MIFIFFAYISTLYGQAQPLKTGDTAPGLFLSNINGQVFFLSDYYGQPRQLWKNQERVAVIISSFATRCAPCMQEISELHALTNEYEGKVIFFPLDVKVELSLVTNYSQQKWGHTARPPGHI
ncbi:MAG TPA: hypothetical protein PLP19_00680 [bacterium]|nr:hypothetical protein [bacterium]HPN41979.1 hypothetical protein [bacterium]